MISLELPEVVKQTKEMMHGLANDIFRPISRKYDEKEHVFPEELNVFKGLIGADKQKPDTMPENKKKDKNDKTPSYENLSTVVMLEELCWGDLGLMMTIPGIGLGNAAITAVGSPEQKEKYGSKWAAMAITEPEAGSDSASVQTTAVLDGDEWILNGEKIFVTCADRCDVVVVWANIDPSIGKAGIKSFVVEKDTPGLKLEYLEHKLGIRASDTGTFVLKDCRVPKENLLGTAEISKKKSFGGVMQTFDNTRPSVAAMALGVAKAALEFTQEKMKEKGFTLDYEESPNNLSAMERDFYKMDAEIDAMRLLIWQAAAMADSGNRNSLQASMCKAKAGKIGTEITQKCCDLLGPMGFSQEHLAEKWMRDVKITDIFEGTGQIQHLIVARQLLKLSSKELK